MAGYKKNQRGSICKNCNVNTANPGHAWCQSCFVKASPSSQTRTDIILKDIDQNKQKSIANQFNASKKPFQASIICIYSVWCISHHISYEKYKNTISQKNGGDSNERRWWHGSTLGCDLWNTRKVCNNSSCNICGILTKGFLLNSAGKNFQSYRFGKGLYFAPDAGKSNDYAKPHNGVKCLILCKVTAGKPMIYNTDQPTLTGPPSGYDSVLGSQAIDFSELVLYDEKAVLPSYVIFYT